MERVVFTNGCFDILHPGHVSLLTEARSLGSKLIVGINSDASVRKIKGANRPFVDQQSRRAVLNGLKAVDEVIIFDEPTPESLIRRIKPDVLVKGGDWKISEIVGADFVLKNGGEVFSLPLKEGFSTTQIAERINSAGKAGAEKGLAENGSPPAGETIIYDALKKHSEICSRLAEQDSSNIEQCAELIFEILRKGNKLLFCGDGESAAVARCLAARFAERDETAARTFPLIVSALNAPQKDADSEQFFSEQVESAANEGDLLIAASIGEYEPNIIAAVMKAREKNCRVLVLTGEGGRKLASLSDACIMIPSGETARIREAQITVGNIWCELMDTKVAQS